VAAGEHEAQAVVGNRILLSGFAAARLEERQLALERLRTTDLVDRTVPCGRQKPGGRVLGQAAPWPALRGGRERIPEGVLGEVEVAEDADQGGEDATPFLAEDPVELARFSQPAYLPGRTP
jgi:hypothetical protein